MAPIWAQSNQNVTSSRVALTSKTQNELELRRLRQKKAWDLALAPAKQVPMQAFMMWMSGSGVQIFRSSSFPFWWYNRRVISSTTSKSGTNPWTHIHHYMQCDDGVHVDQRSHHRLNIGQPNLSTVRINRFSFILKTQVLSCPEVDFYSVPILAVTPRTLEGWRYGLVANSNVRLDYARAKTGQSSGSSSDLLSFPWIVSRLISTCFFYLCLLLFPLLSKYVAGHGSSYLTILIMHYLVMGSSTTHGFIQSLYPLKFIYFLHFKNPDI